MSVPAITAADLIELSEVFPDLDFSDPERQATLLEAGTRDVHAAPGSGKTTLLAAKLYLLLKKWPHERRGICVISHTNVASEEITRRLLATPEGARLLSYPHFIGTIHSFVNKFLALPYMHSRTIPIEIIDNDVFSKRALQIARADPVLEVWLKNSPKNATAVISTLAYQGKDLSVTPLDGDMVQPTAQSYKRLHALKKRLTDEGVHLFEDTLAYAGVVLETVPSRSEMLSQRFPLVLVDEMQDTSYQQETLLTQMFDDSVVMQRFGDQNQRIFSNDAHASKLTFPKPNCLNITTSKRFSAEIAAAASSVQLVGQPIVGEGPSPVAPPTLILYATSAVEKVIPYFGGLVLDTFPAEVLKAGPVKAICTRKQCSANEDAGRHLGDYWPPFVVPNKTGTASQDLAWTLLTDRKETIGVPHGLQAKTRAVLRLFLLIFRAVNPSAVQGVRDGSQLFKVLDGQGIDTTALRKMVRAFVIRRELTSIWPKVVIVLFRTFEPHLPSTFTQAQFESLSLFQVPPAQSTAAAGQAERECIVERSDKRVSIRIDTVAGTKGETHLATLVLESHGGHSYKFDLAMGLANLCGASGVQPGWSDLIRGQYRNMYVAMSRPSQMLCLAMNKERADAAHVARLKTGGWAVHELT